MSEARDPMLDFLEARIAEDEMAARRIQDELEQELKEKYTGMGDESGPPTPERILSGQLWAHYDGQSRTRSFEKGQYLARMAAPSRVLAECRAKRAIIAQHQEWPVLVEREPELSGNDGGMEEFSYRVSQQIAWLTEREYVKKFGVEPPTAPMIRILASVYADHRDFRPEWEPLR